MNSRNQSNFARALQLHGLHHPSCGVAAIQLLQSLQKEAMTHEVRVSSSKKSQGASCMGVCIRAGLAVYEAATKLYKITPKGAQWLKDLKAKGLMPGNFMKEAAQ